MIINTKKLLEKTKINYSPDLNPFLDNPYEIIKFIETDVNGEINKIDKNKIVLELHIKSKLILASSFSLKEVPSELEFDISISFGNTKDDDFIYQDTINLDEIIFGEIYTEKPLQVIHPSDDIEGFE